MKAYKWNFRTHKYEPYNLPKGAVMKASLDELVKCADCGKEVLYGTLYTSMAIHNRSGIGFCVCGKCLQKELKQRFKRGRK